MLLCPVFKGQQSVKNLALVWEARGGECFQVLAGMCLSGIARVAIHEERPRVGDYGNKWTLSSKSLQED